MTKATPFKEQILQLICLFLEQNGQAFVAQELEAKFELPEWLSKGNPLLKKGLTKIIKQYVRENKKINQYFANRKPDQRSDEQIEEKIENPKKTKKQDTKQKQVAQTKTSHKKATVSVWMNGFDEPKLLEDIEQDLTAEKNTKITVIKHGQNIKTKKKGERQQEKQKTTRKKSEQKRKVQSQEQSSSQQEQVKPKKKLKIEIKEEKKKRKASKQVVQAKSKKQDNQVKTKKQVQLIQQQKPENGNLQTRHHTYTKRVSTPGQAFTRINKQDVLPVCQARRDNSFQAKFRYGGGDQWGKFGHQKLKDTRGDSFKKTKGKLKNNAFQAAGIDVNRVNSIKII